MNLWIFYNRYSFFKISQNFSQSKIFENERFLQDIFFLQISVQMSTFSEFY